MVQKKKVQKLSELIGINGVRKTPLQTPNYFTNPKRSLLKDIEEFLRNFIPGNLGLRLGI